MKKKLIMSIAMLTVCFGMTACGGTSQTADKVTEQSSEAVSTEQASVAETTVPAEETEAATEPASGEETAAAANEEGFAAFGQKIKSAVMANDFDALTELVSFPTYVGSSSDPAVGSIISSKEAFMALDPATVLSEGLIAAISNVDPATLTPVDAGYVMMEGIQGPSITFDDIDGNGTFGITGMGY